MYDPVVAPASLRSRLRLPSIRPRRRSASRPAIVGALALFPIATLAIALVEAPPLSIPDASPIYLVAVVGVAVVLGTAAAIAAAVLSFLLYDWLFVAPRFTLIVEDPAEYLNLLLLLFVGIVIGRLVALQSERAEDAARRARESQALFRISRTLVTAPRVADALPAIVHGLATETRMDRVWIGRLHSGREVIVADSGQRTPSVASDPRPPDTDAWRSSGALGPHAPARRTPRQRSDRATGVRAVPDEDHRRRRDAGLHLGDTGTGGRASRPRGDAPAQSRGRPGRARVQAREARRGGEPPPRSPGRARPSRTRSSIRCRTTCARRSPRSAPRPAA